MKVLQTKRSKIPCRYRNCNNLSCSNWHPPVCQDWMQNLATSAILDMLRQMKAQQKVKERLCERISCFIAGVYSIGLCVSRFSSDKIFSTWREKIGIETRCKILQKHLHQIQIRERKGPSRGIIQNCVPHMSVVLAHQSLRRGHMRRLCNWKDAAAEWHGIWWTNIYKLKSADNATFCTSIEARAMPAPTSKSPEEREFVVDSGASVHILSKKEFKLRWTGDSAEIQEPHNGGNGQQRSANKRGSTSITFTILISSWRMTRLQFYHLENSAKNADIPVSGPAVKNHVWPNKERTCCAKRKISYLLLSPKWSSNSGTHLVLYIATAGLVKYILKSSTRAKWRSGTRKLARFTRHHKTQKTK